MLNFQKKKKIVYGPLYATSSKGDIKMWQAEIVENLLNTQINYTYGLDTGKKQNQEVYIDTGKNIGRSNETTHFEQAVKIVESKLNSKMDKGYGVDRNNIETPILPMLALPFTKRKHNIEYPAFVQPKIDGVRMTCRIIDGKIEMFTRKGKPFAKMEHIENNIKKILHGMPPTFYLDGELYSDTLTFQQVAGIVRRMKGTDSKILSEIKYKVFDCFSTSDEHFTFQERLNTLQALPFRNILPSQQYPETVIALDKRPSPISLIKTILIALEDQVYTHYNKFMREGAEGIIIRNALGLYKLNHRSADLQKYKQFEDDEFKIIDFTMGGANETGAVIWICVTKDKEIFNVRPKGSLEDRRRLFKEARGKYVGKYLTVRYQELTDGGIPRFPVGISIRDYE
tara:strand:- start:26048 stop:27241 length:1194 start_codon:yes stop_codon:yes gene_type:complete